MKTSKQSERLVGKKRIEILKKYEKKLKEIGFTFTIMSPPKGQMINQISLGIVPLPPSKAMEKRAESVIEECLKELNADGNGEGKAYTLNVLN